MTNAVAAATPTSVPVRPAVWTNVASITPTPIALTPIEAPRASRRLPSPVSRDVRPDRDDPLVEPRAEPLVEARRRAPQRRIRGDGVGDGAVLGPGRRRSARRLGGVEAGDGQQVVGRGLADLRRPARRDGRKMLAIAPRTAPIPFEKIRVTSSAPT